MGKKDIIRLTYISNHANTISWAVVAPILDIVVYAEPVNLVFTQGIVATIMNAISAGVIGSVPACTLQQNTFEKEVFLRNHKILEKKKNGMQQNRFGVSLIDESLRSVFLYRRLEQKVRLAETLATAYNPGMCLLELPTIGII